MHFFCIDNTLLLSKPLSPVSGCLVSLDRRQQGGLSSQACGHYRPVLWCYLVPVIGNTQPVRPLQFLYMIDEDLMLLLAFSIYMLYFCLAPITALFLCYVSSHVFSPDFGIVGERLIPSSHPFSVNCHLTYSDVKYLLSATLVSKVSG